MENKEVLETELPMEETVEEPVVEEVAVEETAVEEPVVAPDESLEAVDEPDNPTEEEVAEEPEEEASEDDALMFEWKRSARDMAHKFFEEISASDLPFGVVEMIPDFMKGLIAIHRGKSKLWAEGNAVLERFFETPIKDLELYESVEESNQKPEGVGGEGTV